MTMEDVWNFENKIDLVVTLRDLSQNLMRFVKPWKEE